MRSPIRASPIHKMFRMERESSHNPQNSNRTWIDWRSRMTVWLRIYCPLGWPRCTLRCLHKAKGSCSWPRFQALLLIWYPGGPLCRRKALVLQNKMKGEFKGRFGRYDFCLRLSNVTFVAHAKRQTFVALASSKDRKHLVILTFWSWLRHVVGL